MRTIRLLALVLVLSVAYPLTASAQNTFRFTPSTTQIDTTEPAFVQFLGTLENISEQDDIYILTRYLVETPDDWTSSMCTHWACSPPFVDETTDTVAAGGNDPLFSLDVSAESFGTGVIHLRFTSSNVPDDMLEVAFTVVVSNEGVEIGSTVQPVEYALIPVYPNPFNSTSRVAFTLPHASRVKLNVFNMNGRLVERLEDGFLPAGLHTRVFQAGETLASGTYLITLETQGRTFVQRAVLLR